MNDLIGLAGGVNTYGYVGSDPIELTDELGLYHYNAKAPRTVPVTGNTESALSCTESCLRERSGNQGLDLLITGGAETTGHSRKSFHSKGEACDISTKNEVQDDDVFSCAQQCGFGGAQRENFLKNPNRNHWHLQLTPGNGVPKTIEHTVRQK